MNNTDVNKLEPLLVKAIRLILDDSHGITESAHEALMEMVYNIHPNSRALEYLSEAQNYKGRMFLEEGFVLGDDKPLT